MKSDAHTARQREFYDGGEHAHLRAQRDDWYADKLAAGLVDYLGIRPEHRVLELGAGFGRFTFSLLEHCASVVAVDLSSRVLAELEHERDARGIPPERCRTICSDVADLDAAAAGPVDFVVGFFVLHHLPEVRDALARLAPALAPHGAMGFLEPNRRNPAFLIQLLVSPDMSWREERGMFQLSAASVAADARGAGLAPRAPASFGFFPPPIVNRFAPARRLEGWLEARRWLRPVLPFLLLGADAPDGGTVPR